MEIGTVKQIDIQQEMQGAYLDYAMSVIVARALPDVRDGLKPVHRRILYAMHDMGLTHDKSYKKSARIVGEVLGKYHPHGDSAVYDAMVRMAQDFSLRYPLVDGQGNFGSVDGDSPAAMRYTEARLAALSREMLADIDKETVDFGPNFDETLQEPLVLPALLPNLLVNGASGIAVGMATNIPPHNLNEVCDALIHLIDRYDEVDEVTVADLMQFIKGPDFPTAGLVYSYDSDGEDVIARAYATGRGRFRVQARAHIEAMSRNRNRIVVTELPYQVNKTRLIERIASLARDGKLEGLTDLRDESDRTGMRIIIEMTRNVDPKQVLVDLYKYTPMQQTFGMIMLALVDGEPRLLSLRRVLQHYVEHRREIIRRRSEYDLARAKARAHIVEGLLRALDILDQVIQTIRRSRTTATARTNLMRNFKFSELQAQAILDMPLKRLAALERKRLQDEYDELRKQITYLEDLLAHPGKILGVIKDDLARLKEQYGDARRTRIVEAGVTRDSLTVRDVLEDEPVTISLGPDGLLLREKLAGRRRGKLPSKVNGKAPLALAAGTTHNELFIFSADGRMGRVPIHRLRDGEETHPADLGIFNRNDRLVDMIIAARPEPDGAEIEEYLVLATRDGRVKRIAAADAWAAIDVTTAMKVDDGDELIGVATSDGTAEIMLVSRMGQSIRFKESDVRAMGLSAAGVWGIKLSSGDEVAALTVTRPDGELLIITSTGYCKRTGLKQFSIQGRHGSGVLSMRLGRQSGAIVAARVAQPGDEFFSASRRGTVRRIDLADLPASSRAALGKLLIQPAQGDAIRNLLHLPTSRPRSPVKSAPSGSGSPGGPAKSSSRSRASRGRSTGRRKASTGKKSPAKPAGKAKATTSGKAATGRRASKSKAASAAKPAGTRRRSTAKSAPEKTAPAKSGPETTASSGSKTGKAPAKKPATRKPRTSGKSAAKTGKSTGSAKSTAKKPATKKKAAGKQLSLLDKLRSV